MHAYRFLVVFEAVEFLLQLVHIEQLRVAIRRTRRKKLIVERVELDAEHFLLVSLQSQHGACLGPRVTPLLRGVRYKAKVQSEDADRKMFGSIGFQLTSSTSFSW